MNNVKPGPFFEAFNAKYLEPEQVAAGYVYSSHFEELSGPYHAVLIGPRGSGKTTLLKMLQPAALDTWRSRRAADFRKKINYSGVFISSDISWSRQLNALGYGKLSAENHRTLILACFTTHVLQAVVEAMILRASKTARHRAVSLADWRASMLAKQLLELLKLDGRLASLLSVKQALRARLSEIRQLANRGSLQDQDKLRDELAATKFLHLDFLDICSNITTLFNDAVDEKGARWALLFDELETAPDWIVEQLFSAFRVADPKLYLKLAISPVSVTAYKALMSADGPADGQDHRQIRLWYTDRVDAKGFCEAVWKYLINKQDLNLTAREALGHSAFEPASPAELKRRNPYAPGEHWATVFNSLKAKDRSFAAFLRARNIDLQRLGSADQQMRDSVLRKAAPIAAVRDFYLHEDRKGNIAPKHRKTTALYAGAESIFAISEGNPRWLIGLLTPMISYMIENNIKRVPPSVQAEEIDNAADRLLALLRTIPIPLGGDRNEALGLNGIVRAIGVRLHDELMNKNFSIDPKLSFTIDKEVPSSSIEMLSSALNRGAVILVTGSPALSIVGNMTGVTLRLSYLLAAKYGIPLRRGKSTNLSALLALPASDDEKQLGLKGL